MSAHTPEPWAEYGLSGGRYLAGQSGQIITDCYAPGSQRAADMARAMACVNACAGMSDPAAEVDALRRAASEAALNGSAIDACRRVIHEIMGGHLAFIDDDVARCMVTLRDENAALRAERDALKRECDDLLAVKHWNEGYPPHPYDKEWFIAVTTFGDRVVLRALPDEYAYDYTTVDETYLKKELVAKWMQFPDTEFKTFDSAALARSQK